MALHGLRASRCADQHGTHLTMPGNFKVGWASKVTRHGMIALDKNRHEWHNTPCKHRHGGVGAPVGLTVFKTAGGSLGAVPGGFDSHTPLPLLLPNILSACLLTHWFWRFSKTMLPFW